MQQLFHSYFSNTQLTLIVLSAVLLIGSFFFLNKKRDTITVIALMGSAFFVFSFAATLDPFLNLWDERFHALVAKNMMTDPFRPTLYADTMVHMSYDTWDRYHIWLHKQPLFLWQIAGSFKIFGISEYTLRLPSVILGTIITGVAFRMGKILFNSYVGFFTALLFISSPYLIALVSGRQAVDHNDMAFLAYVSLSIWSFVEYQNSGKKRWILCIGIFAGMAILCKWLVGLLIYLGWGVHRNLERKYRLRENRDFILAFVITIVVCLPWQLYTLLYFPKAAGKALEYNGQHFTEVIEGHDGSVWFHFEWFSTLFGIGMVFLLVPGIVFAYRNIKDRNMFWSLLAMTCFVYIFFSIAATKMPSFTLINGLTIFLLGATTIVGLLQLVKHAKTRTLLLALVAIGLFFLRIDLEQLQEKHTVWRDTNHYTRQLASNRRVFKKLQLNENTLIFNVPGRHFVEAMFYTDCMAYDFVPSAKAIKRLKKMGKSIAVFETPNSMLPHYILEDSNIEIIDAQLFVVG